MTDLTTKDNKYYTVSQFNPTNNNVNAQTNDVLLYPIIENASDYQVAISKARIDLSGIPLTTHNIPLKTYEVGLKNGSDEYTAFVRQLNAENKNYLYNVSTGGTYSKYVYLTGGTTTQVNLPNAIPISTYLKTVFQFVETDYQNVFVVGSVNQNSNNYETLIGFNAGGSVIYQATYDSIQGICLDRQSNLYIAIEAGDASNITVYKLIENTNPIQINLETTITQDANGDDLVQIQSICAEAELIVCSEANKITIYDTVSSWNPITTYNEPQITQSGSQSAILSAYDRFCVQDLGAMPDLLFGVPAGTNTQFNFETNAVFQAGSWLSTAKMSLWSAGTNTTYGYGVGTNQQTYYFPYANGTQGPNAPLPDTSLMASCFNGFQPNSVEGIFAGTTGAFVGLNINQVATPTNDWSVISRTFFPNGTNAPISCDTQSSTGRVLAIDSSNNLKMTSTTVLPKCFITVANQQIGQTKSMLFQIQGVGLNNSGLNAYTNIIKNSTLFPSTLTIPNINGFVKSADLGWLFYSQETIPSGPNTATLSRIGFPTLATQASVDVSALYGEITTGNIAYVQTSNTVVVSPGGSNVYLYDGTTLASVQTIVLPFATPLGFGVPVSTFTFSGVDYLAVSYANNVAIYDITNRLAPSLLSNQLFAPSGYTVSYIGGLGWVETGSGNYLVMSTDLDGSPSNQTGLWKVLLDGGLNFVPSSEVLIDNTTKYALANGNCISINKNISGTEISVMGGSSSSLIFSGTVSLYNFTAGVKVSQFTTTNTENAILFYCPEVDYVYTWDSVTQTGTPIVPKCVAFSQNTPNLVFALDNAGIAYSGNITNTQAPTIEFTAYTPLAGGTYDTINAIVQVPGVYDTYVRNYAISNQTAEGDFHYSAIPVQGIARNAISGEFLVSAGGTLTSYAPSNFSSQWTNATITGLNLIYSKNSEDIDAGDANIYDFQTLIDAINLAFEEAFAKAPSGVFTQAPSVSLNFNNGLATLTYSSDYTSTPKGILMNSDLHQLLYYFSVKDDFNPNYFRIVLPANSTSLTQTSKSLYLFNQLDKILFISNTIFVFGSYFGANNTNNIITDIDVPTNSDGYMNNLGQVVYYQPSFLRPFILSSNIPLSRIQMEVWYSTLSGEQYQLQLVPDGNWNAKLIFPRRY